MFTFFFAAMTNRGWRPGPGDPTLAGWIIFGGYLIVAVRASTMARREAAQGLDPFMWRALMVACVGLALNKQLDLHNSITALGRSLALAEGWYAQRRTVQLALIAVIIGASIAVVWYMLVRLGSAWRRHWLILAGMVTLLAFIAIRTASFHHIDTALRVELGGVRLHAVIEMLGIALLFFGANRAAQKTPRDTPAD